MVKLLAIIRVRGTSGLHPDAKITLSLLRLHKPNHMVIMEDTQSIQGMLKKVSNWVTWGELSNDTLSLVLRKRGYLSGDERLTDEYVRKYTKYASIDDLARAIIRNEIKLKEIPKLKPVFRLHPPSGGYKKSIKKHYRDGGELGYRGEAINSLIKRMI